MPMVPVADESGPRVATGVTPPESPDIPFYKTLGAAFLESNSAVSGMARIYNSGTFAPQPGYNPLGDIKDTPYFQTYPDRFAGSRSPAETESIKAQISREEAAKKTVAESGTLGTVAGLVAGAVDPVWLLAFGGGGVARAGLVRTGIQTAAGMSAQEALLHASQETRGMGESIQNVAAGTLIWAMIGGGAAKLLHSEGKMPAAEASLDQARAKMTENAAGPETILKPAVLVDGKIYTGLMHPDAVEAAAKETGIPRDEIFKIVRASNLDGFLTSTGRYVDRKTAWEIAQAADQMKPGKQAVEGSLDSQDFWQSVPGEIPPSTGEAGETAVSPVRAVRTSDGVVHSINPAETETELLKRATKNISAREAAATPGYATPEMGYVDKDGKFLTRGEAAAANENLPGTPAAAGAAYSDTRNLSPAPYGLESLPSARSFASKMFPNLDVLENGLDVTKRTVAEMAEIPIATKGNLAGETTTLRGGPAADREITMFREAKFSGAGREMMRLWTDYLGADAQPGLLGKAQRMMGRAPEGKMSFDEFDAAVGDALRLQDKHEVPQVAAMAQWLRREVYEPVSKRAEAIDGFKPIEPRDGESYAPQIWAKDLIKARWNGFVDMWTNHLSGQQAVKAAAKERLIGLNTPLQEITVQMGKLEAKHERLMATKAKIEAKAQERASETVRTTDRAEGLDLNKMAHDDEIAMLKDSLELLRDLKAQKFGPLSEAQSKAAAALNRQSDALRTAKGKAGEAGRSADINQNRLDILLERADYAKERQEIIESALETSEQARTFLRSKIEAEIAAWEGKSSGEAKAALKAREKYEIESAIKFGEKHGIGAQRPETAGRLTSADSAVDKTVERIIASDRDLSRQELRSRAQEIGDRILSTPEGRLPYDEHMGGPQIGIPSATTELRGHAAHRAIDLPYDVAAPWLNRSATQQMHSYLHSVLPDAVLAERFGGDPNMTVKFKEIADAYNDKLARYKSEGEQARIKNRMADDMTIVAGMRDRIRGVFGYDQGSNTARVAQGALKINNIVSSHMMAVSSLPDFAGAVFRHAFEQGFGGAWSAYFRGLLDNEAWAAVKAQGHELQAMGIGIETERASRQHALDGITENYRPNSRFERALSWASDKSFIVNLLTPLTDIQKRISGNVAMNGILRASQAVAEGKATKRQLDDLAAGNIRLDVAERIWKQYSEGGGEQVKGVYLPNTAGWADAEVRLAFQGAVARDVDIAVVTPGQEKPFWMSKPGWNLLGQYSTFAVSATQRILIANLQRADAATAAGLVMSVAMGMLAYRINTAVSGQPASDRPQDWFKEGISRSGVLGAIDNANTITSKLTGGALDIYRGIGADKPLSRTAGRNAAEVLLGPTYGKVQNLARATSAAGRMDWTEADTHALRMVFMGSNLPYLPRLFDGVETGFNNAFGIPMKAKPQ